MEARRHMRAGGGGGGGGGGYRRRGHDDGGGGGDEPRRDHSAALYQAVCEDDVASLQQLLGEGANPNTYYSDEHNISSQYLLHVACSKGAVQCIRALVDGGASVDNQDQWGQIPLHYCCSRQSRASVQMLLTHVHPRSRTAVVNHQDSFGKTPLHTSAEKCDVDTVRLLVHYEALVNLVTIDGLTPLMLCAQQNQLPQSPLCLRMLIDAGATLDMLDFREGRSALQWSVLHRNVAGVKVLLEAGASVDQLDTNHRTPLTTLMWRSQQLRDLHRYQLGMMMGGNINTTRVKEMEEYSAKELEIAEILLRAGADLNRQTSDRSNPLMAAAMRGNIPLFCLFLKHGANPNVTFATGVSPLLVVTTNRMDACVRALLSHNASMTTKGLVMRTRLQREDTFDPPQMALDQGCYHLVKLFLQAGYDVGRIHQQLQTNLSRDKDRMEGDVHQWLTERMTTPPRLRDLAVFCFRQHQGHRLLSVVPTLPVPSAVKDGLLLKDLLSCDRREKAQFQAPPPPPLH